MKRIEKLRAAMTKMEEICRSDIESAVDGIYRDAFDSTSNFNLVLDPESGFRTSEYVGNFSCSAEEYFSENGVLSEKTLLTVEGWFAGPDAGYEWEEDEDGEYICIGGSGDWKEFKDWVNDQEEDEPVIPEGSYRFNVSANPVEMDCYYEVYEEVEKKIEAMVKEIEAEIDATADDEI